MKRLMSIAAGTAVAGALGLAAFGIGTGVANAAPPIAETQWAQWGPGPGPWGGPWGGPGWGPPPPPPPPYYGYGGYGDYGGYDAGPPCVTGPLGFLHVCA